MKYWPLPNSYQKTLPQDGEPGSFWEDRGDRRHCGVDIAAPENSEVVAVEGGYVVDKGQFSVSGEFDFHDDTYFIAIKTPQKLVVKYAGLKEVYANIGDYVEAGQVIGILGKIIDEEKISPSDPFYVQSLAESGRNVALHLEIYKAPITIAQPYDTGNYLGERKPSSLIDPELYLNGLIKKFQTA